MANNKLRQRVERKSEINGERENGNEQNNKMLIFSLHLVESMELLSHFYI